MRHLAPVRRAGLPLACTAALVLAAACGGHKAAPAPAPAPAPAAAAAPADAAPAETCEDWCTTYAGCWEEKYGGDFHRGGDCVDNCESKSPEEQRAWGAQVDHASVTDCASLFEGDD
jgi:hypothetical protein